MDLTNYKLYKANFVICVAYFVVDKIIGVYILEVQIFQMVLNDKTLFTVKLGTSYICKFFLGQRNLGYIIYTSFPNNFEKVLEVALRDVVPGNRQLLGIKQQIVSFKRHKLYLYKAYCFCWCFKYMMFYYIGPILWQIMTSFGDLMYEHGFDILELLGAIIEIMV